MRRYIAFASLLALLTACPSGYRFVHTNGEPFAIDESTWNRVDCIAKEVSKATGSCQSRRLPKIWADCSGPEADRNRCVTTPLDRAHPVIGESAKLTELISFVHMSDAQLKEEAIHMDGALDDVQYDALTNGALRDPDLERNDDAVLLATTLSINEMRGKVLTDSFAPYLPPSPPSFVIHTGDSVDSGVYSELVQFIAAMDALDMPWFNAIGNHDNLFFGTFPASEMKGMDVLAPYVPIVDTDRFMRFHSVDGVARDASLPNLASRNANHVPTSRGQRIFPDAPAERVIGQISSYHGFDLACAPRGVNDPAEKGSLCPDARGYYAFDAPLADHSGNLRSIVLNTAQITPTTVGSGFDRRSRGNMYPEQLRWLKQQLAEDRPDLKGEKGRDLFIVYGHHDLDSFLHDDQGKELEAILTSSPRVLAYVTGHRHQDMVLQRKRPDGSPFWEVLAGSTLVFPELGQLLDLVQDNDRNLYLRVTPFRQQLGDDLSKLDSAPILVPPPKSVASASAPPLDDAAPAKPNTCATLAEGNNFCFRLAARAHLGRKGASRDDDNDRRDESVAVERTAGILPLGKRPTK